jgi:hypothetical protein
VNHHSREGTLAEFIPNDFATHPFYGPLNDAHTAEEAPLPPNYPGFPIDGEPRFYRFLRERFQKEGYRAYVALPGHDLRTAIRSNAWREIMPACAAKPTAHSGGFCGLWKHRGRRTTPSLCILPITAR